MRKLKCVEVAMNHPDKLNEEGKVNLGEDIIRAMFPEELDTFLNEWGYTRKDNPKKIEEELENE